MVVRIGFYQYDVVFADVQANLRLITAAMESSNADLLVFPELALSGYLHSSRETLAPLSQTVPGNETDLLVKTAQKTGCAAVIGFSEAADGGLYNSAMFVTPDGVDVYRKVHLFGGEKDLFLPGNLGFPVFFWKEVVIGISVCFDHYFPEGSRVLAEKGAQIVCHPANLVLPGKAQLSTRVRAFENRMFWVLGNRIGTEKLGKRSFTYTGQSQILDPDGEILASAGADNQSLSVIDIDPAAAKNKRVAARNNVLEDRRPDQYR